MHVRMSAYKARVVLDLIRNKDVATADEILRFSDREAAAVIRKVLRSAVANAEHNDEQIPEDLFVSACFADEGKTLRRMRPRARGRATRIRKRTTHITVIVSRIPEAELNRRREQEATRPGSRAARRAGQQVAEERKRRVRRGRQEAANPEEHEGHDHEGHDHDHDHDHEHDEEVVTESEVAVDDAVGAEADPSESGGEPEAVVAAEPEAGLVAEEEPSVSDETKNSPAENRGEAD
jgi:large subunit ribosomal protein L22